MVLTDYLLRASLALIMFSIGLSLKKEHFKEVFQKPKELSVGLFFQIILLPLLAFLVLQFFDLPTGIKIGILVLAISPGGTTSNLISYITNARTSLSVSMTGANSLIVLFSIPLLLGFFLEYYGQETLGDFARSQIISELVLVIAIPVFVGVLINEKKPNFSFRWEKIFRRSGLTFLATVLIVKFLFPASQGGASLGIGSVKIILPALLTFHVLALFMGFFGSKLFGVKDESAITIGIETGLQNTALALLISSTVLQNELASHPALIYSLFSFFTTALFSLGLKKASGKKTDLKV